MGDEASASDSAFIVDLQARLRKVEGKVELEEKSVVKKVSLYGALIALLVSILTGGFNVYEKVIQAPSRQYLENRAELRGIVGRITQINWRLAELGFESDPRKAQNVARIANGEKLALLERATDMVKSDAELASTSNLMVLATEHLNFGNTQDSLSFANQAVLKAESLLLKSESLRHKARAISSMSTDDSLEDARQIYELAVTEAMRSSTIAANSVIANIYGDWALMEMWSGECGLADMRLSDLKGILQKRSAPLVEYQTVAANLEQMRLLQGRC